MTQSQTIALIDDDRNITTSVSMMLQVEGFTTIIAHDGEDGFKLIKDNKPDLAILDIKMPRMDGMELLKKLRTEFTLPIIMLTSKDDEIDQISGLQSGADDYITKPFSQKLLLERIRSLLRRVSLSSVTTSSIHHGDLEMNDERHEIKWQGKNIVFTVTEYLLVRSLAFKPGIVKTRDQLITDAYDESTFVDDRIIDTHIKRIRKKFRDCDETFDKIETLYGVGYRYKDK
jgi:two-component system response regulator ChvI